MSAPAAIRRVVIRGRVQGVGFRAWTEHEAHRRALDGWVRNRRDGSVEALFAGPPEMVASMIAACRHGPTLAAIEAIEEHAAGLDDLARRVPGEKFSLLATA